MMNKIVLAAILSLAATPSFAKMQETNVFQGTSIVLAAPFIATSYTAIMSTLMTGSCVSNNCSVKLILAQEDAAAFIASEGRVRGVKLQSALEMLRQANPSLSASDLEIAQTILAL
ncbi:hypothetical protein D3C72_1515810 [compost metagenome]